MSNAGSPVLGAVFAVVCTLLVLKSQVLGAATASMRGKLGQFVHAEDAAWLGGERVERDGERVDRIARAHRNDLENLVPFFIGGALYLLGNGPVVAGAFYFLAFLLARYAHTYAFMRRRALFRRNAYTAGWLVSIALAAHATWNLLRAALA